MSDIQVPTVTLDNGVTMPQIGFGTAQLSDDQAEQALESAFDVGYRKVDTASAYSNERGIGRAIAESGLPRQELFVTTKVWNTEQGRVRARDAFEKSLDRLGLDHVDLYLIHWPAPARGLFVETWQVLEELYAEGLVRAIGVSNFRVQDLDVLLENADVRPTVNQVELHPYASRADLRSHHARLGMVTEAWAPLHQGGLLDDPALTELANRNGLTVAQLVLRWHLQIGNSVIPRSQNPARMRANLATGALPPLSAGDLEIINQSERGQALSPDPAEFN
ncbi:aldo/keto reductase [Streptomyces sp. NPDC026672]|uniref:aldo/keto reductase n=1 Tax=unclassified Streptomyces TaxID=2593676 RepID=UPI0033F2A5FC